MIMKTLKSTSTFGINYNLSSLIHTLTEKKGLEIRKEVYKQLHTIYKNGEDNELTEIQRRKIEICYDLYNSNGFSNSRKIFNKVIKEQPFGLPANIKFRHFPIIGPIAAHRVGERAARRSKFSIIDTSGYTANLVKQKINEKLAQWLSETTVDPLINQLYMQELQKYGVEDPLALPPDDRKQLLSQAQEQAQALLPEAIFEKFNKDYVSVVEERGARFLNYLIKQGNAYDNYREAYKSMMISGACLFKQGVRFNKPYLEHKNYLKAKIYKKPEERFFENADAVVYRDFMSPIQFYMEYYPQLTPAEQKLANQFPVTGNPHGSHNDIQGQFLANVVKGNVPMGQVSFDTNSTQGMMDWIKTLGMHGTNPLMHGSGVPMAHSQIRGLRPVKEVYRWEEDGSVGIYYLSAEYQLNPREGDIKFDWVNIDEIYETTEFFNGIFTQQRRVPYQYTNVLHPFDKVKLQYSGGTLSNLQGNTTNTSPMMKAVTMQYSYDLHSSLLDKDIANNIGKVLQILTNVLGTSTPEEFSRNLKSAKILPIDAQKLGMTVDQLNAIKILDFNNVVDATARREHLREIRNDAVMSMNYNPDRLGYPSPYKNNANVENSIEMSNAQTLDEELLMDQIEENVMQNYFDLAIQVYSNNPLETRYMTDDGDKAFLSFTKESAKDLAAASLNVKIVNSVEDAQLLDATKRDLLEQNRVQPGYLEPDEVVEIRMTKSIAKILNIGRKAKARMEKQRQQEQAMQQQLQEMLLRSKAEETDKKMKHEKDLLESRLETDRYKADKQSETLDRGFDVDQDGQSNAEETQKILSDAKERMHKIDTYVRLKELEVDKIKASKSKSS